MFKKLKSLANTGINSAISAVKNNEEIQGSLIDKVASINFVETLEFIDNNEKLIPQNEIVRSTILTLHDASNEYFLSQESNKNSVFINSIINNIDPIKAINAFEPIVKFIPFGGVILFVLKAIVKYRKFSG